MSQNKEAWGSRLGVIMAVAGSAVGLGNFLRFPGLAAQYGGGAFMLAYAISFLIIGLPGGWVEWAMGRYAGSRGYNSAPGAFAVILNKPWAKYVGVIGVIVPVVIYMYYVFIESWCLGYAVKFWTGGVDLTTTEQTVAMFKGMSGQLADGAALATSWDASLPWLVLVFAFNFWLIYRGLSGGIEKMCNFGMPMLIVLALVVLVRVLTLGAPDPARPHDNVVNGLGYMWNPSKVQIERTQPAAGEARMVAEVVGSAAIAAAKQKADASGGALRLVTISPWQQLKNPQLWMAAAAQIFFSLAVGFGIIIVYASYLKKKDDVVLSGLTASSANEFCEVALGGLITVPAAVAFLGIASVAGQGTFGLGFTVLPLVFAKMPLGAFFGGAFFFMLFLAAITSSIAMLQPGIAFLEEAMNVGRKVSVTVLGLLTTLGTGFVAYFSKDLKALDTLDFWVGTFLIFILATIQTLVFGWHWGISRGMQEAHHGATIRIPRLFGGIIKWVCPAFLLTIFAMTVLSSVFGFDFDTLTFGSASSYVMDLIGGTKGGRPVETSLAAQLSVALVLVLSFFFLLLTARSVIFRRAEQNLDKHSTPPSS
ncbi:SLC5/6 family protein [Prosthecobacter vanneervenii]|uniref:SNF family Na+-dependent transporter n=1 Tax=Prosthecobacter vanneervenii TaxID=48466 RepID=A0A7W7Y711_9BACT|nr:sodium:calcium symporter [Prosthecobacter vanneervenii]MBB5030804.1 SNF family Na+-dependent transporter [Prosthecobacter vanneervenii]